MARPFHTCVSLLDVFIRAPAIICTGLTVPQERKRPAKPRGWSPRTERSPLKGASLWSLFFLEKTDSGGVGTI
jgi:hypothetical protein